MTNPFEQASQDLAANPELVDELMNPGEPGEVPIDPAARDANPDLT